MPPFPFKFRWTSLWMVATAAICAAEIYAAASRVHPSPTPNGDLFVRSHVSSTPTTRQTLAIGDVGSEDVHSAILVVNNLDSDCDRELEITLTATTAVVRSSDGDQHVVRRDSIFSRQSIVATQRRPAPTDTAAPTMQRDHRVYFLPSSVGNIHEADHTAVSCRLLAENSYVRIYGDERCSINDAMKSLVREIDELSTTALRETISNLVGTVADLDHDGHLAIVLTPEVGRLGREGTPVQGLTRAADFVSGLDRPQSNNSDVIFLTTSLTPGDQLRAVLAHEWCHAAVFSNHTDSSSANLLTGDDWLNEAIAHFVEVKAGQSLSNVSNRIDNYLSRPSQSPLIVRDYSQPKYWRHDGCRGAAYLFFQYCAEQYGVELLPQLVGDQPLGIDRLEELTGYSWEDLFCRWTRELGESVVDKLSRSHDETARTKLVNVLSWKLEPNDSTPLTIRVRGSAAEFVHLQWDGNTKWSLSAITHPASKCHATLIPADPSNRHHTKVTQRVLDR